MSKSVVSTFEFPFAFELLYHRYGDCRDCWYHTKNVSVSVRLQNVNIYIDKTKMDSGRIRTAGFSGRLRGAGGFLPHGGGEGVCLGGVSANGECLPRGGVSVCLHRGVSATHPCEQNDRQV